MKFTDGKYREIEGKKSAHHKGDKRYRGQFYLVADDGTRKAYSKVFWARNKEKDTEEEGVIYKSAKTQFNEWREETIAKQTAKAEGQNVNMTVCECVESYLDSRTLLKSGEKYKKGESGISRATMISYRGSFTHIEKGFRDTPLANLKPSQVDKWLKHLNDEKSGSTARKAYWLLKASCEYAVRDKNMSTADFAACFPRNRADAPRQAEPDPNPLDEPSVQLLNAFIGRAYANGAPDPFTVSVAIAVLTGMREGEICALRWKNVDLAGSRQYPTGCIHVCSTLSRDGSHYIEKAPKTKKGDRLIPISGNLRATLLAQHAAQAHELKEAGIDAAEVENLFVTGTVDGRFFHPITLSRRWRGLAEGLGLMGTRGRQCTFHDLRHTYATQAIHEGMDVKSVAEILGHKDVSITLNIYADAMPEAKARTMEAVNSLWSFADPKSE